MHRRPMLLGVALALTACTAPQADAPSPAATTPASLPESDHPSPSASATPQADPLAVPSVDGLFEVEEGRRIAVRCWGEGPVVVMEGGDAGTDDYGQASLVRSLAAGAQVCVHDRAGIGLSDPAPDRRRDADDVVEDLRAALVEAGVEPPYVLVGSSFGGLIVTYFAERFGEDVGGVVTLDTPAPIADLTLEDFPEGAWDYPGNTQHLDVIDGFEKRFALEPPTFEAPLIIVTASDGDSDVEDQSFWLQSSPDSRQVELAGGHEIYQDAMADVAAEIRSLISATD